MPSQCRYAPLIYSMMHRIKNRLDDMLAPYGITNQQARLLGLVYSMSQAGRAVCQKDIELAMDLTAPSVSSLIHGLEKNGFLTRSADATDGRRKQLLLTEKGVCLQETFWEIFAEGERAIVKGMTEGQKQMLLELMAMVVGNLRDMMEGTGENG